MITHEALVATNIEPHPIIANAPDSYDPTYGLQLSDYRLPLSDKKTVVIGQVDGGYELGPELPVTNALRVKGLEPRDIQLGLERGILFINEGGILQRRLPDGASIVKNGVLQKATAEDRLDLETRIQQTDHNTTVLEQNAIDQGNSEPIDNPSAEFEYSQGPTFYFNRGNIISAKGSNQHDTILATVDSGRVYAVNRNVVDTNTQPLARFGDDSRIYTTELSHDGNIAYVVQGEWVGEGDSLHYEVKQLHSFSVKDGSKKTVDLHNSKYAVDIKPLSDGRLALLEIEPFKGEGEPLGNTKLTILDQNLQPVAESTITNPQHAAFYQNIWEVDGKIIITRPDSILVYDPNAIDPQKPEIVIPWDAPGDLLVLEDEGLLVDSIPGLMLDFYHRPVSFMNVSDIRGVLNGKPPRSLATLVPFPGYDSSAGPWFQNMGNGMIATGITEQVVRDPDGFHVKWIGGLGVMRVGQSESGTYPLTVRGEHIDGMDVSDVRPGGVLQFGSRVMSSVRPKGTGIKHKEFLPALNNRGSSHVSEIDNSASLKPVANQADAFNDSRRQANVMDRQRKGHKQYGLNNPQTVFGRRNG